MSSSRLEAGRGREGPGLPPLPPPLPPLIRFCCLVQNICIPSLLIVSQDDPVLGPHHHGIAVAAAKANSNIITVTTCTGGHLGWIEASGSWLVKMTVQYIQAIQELSVVSPSSIHLDLLPELQVNYSRHKMSSHRH